MYSDILMNIEIMRLNLISPLYYAGMNDAEPFGRRETGRDELFCFELNENQYLSFEPLKDELLGKLIFHGNAVTPVEAETNESIFCLPQGDYLFAQKREIVSREEIIALAVEIQSEGLWQRLLPGKKLYLRYLFEDGLPVTQLFRPFG
jgi:hypothetical protein